MQYNQFSYFSQQDTEGLIFFFQALDYHWLIHSYGVIFLHGIGGMFKIYSFIMKD